MNEDNLVTYNTQTGQVEFLNKTVTDKSFDDYLMNTVTNEELGLKQGSDTIASGYNKSIDYVEEYLKEYPAIPMYVGDASINLGSVENDKIRRKTLSKEQLSKIADTQKDQPMEPYIEGSQLHKISNSIKDLETNIATHQMQRSINDKVEDANKYYALNSNGDVEMVPVESIITPIVTPIKSEYDKIAELETIAYRNSEKLQSLKFPNISVDLSKLSLKEVTEYFKQCNPIPIKRDSVAEFEKNSLNRRYSVS
jgi:hypothetical protein